MMIFRPTKIPAYLVFQAISLLLILIAVFLLTFSSAVLLFNKSLSGPRDSILLVGGMLLLFIGAIGPVRVIIKSAQIPAEVRRMILVQAVVIPLSGITLMLSAAFSAPTSVALAYLVLGFLVLLSAIAGFYALSKKLPPAFNIGEMLSIMKSAGIVGDKKNSPADREFMRWTAGVREGVRVGATAPDGEVLTMNGKTVLLSSYFGNGDGSPLVLNFGSYTCPHHRKRIDELHSLIEKWENKGVRFLTVYTAEAHTEDGWKLAHQYDNDAEYGNEDDFCFYHAKTIDERRNMAKWLIQKKQFQLPVVLDSMANDLLKSYNSWPIRLYIIVSGKVAYCGEQGPFGYDPTSVDEALQKIIL